MEGPKSGFEGEEVYPLQFKSGKRSIGFNGSGGMSQSRQKY
jgi:hypothetical protein